MAKANCSTPDPIKKNSPMVFPDPALDAFADKLYRQGMAMANAEFQKRPFKYSEIRTPKRLQHFLPSNF